MVRIKNFLKKAISILFFPITKLVNYIKYKKKIRELQKRDPFIYKQEKYDRLGNNRKQSRCQFGSDGMEGTGLTDHYALRLKWAGMSKDFSGVAGDPTLCPKLMAEVRANPKWAFPAKIYFYEKPLKKTMRQLIAGQGWKWKENNLSLIHI